MHHTRSDFDIRCSITLWARSNGFTIEGDPKVARPCATSMLHRKAGNIDLLTLHPLELFGNCIVKCFRLRCRVAVGSRGCSLELPVGAIGVTRHN